MKVYVQAHDEPNFTNTNAARSLDCMYLRTMDSAQGGNELLQLQTNMLVKRRKLTKIPIMRAIIKEVYKIAEMDNL